jgi:DNA ligase 1
MREVNFLREITMPDLRDGESVTMQGSGSRPYVLKNVGGVYSCTCPAWRNQSLGVERRTCKHLRKLRGDAAEQARIGGALPVKPKEAKGAAQIPPLLLAECWDGVADPAGWLLSEKLDGVRAYWDGMQFLSRLGNLFHAPGWFQERLPTVPLDGELWMGRKAFQRTVSVVRRQEGGDGWREVCFLVFDAPAASGGFEERLDFVRRCLDKHRPNYARRHDHIVCGGVRHLNEELNRVTALGGEGLMLRQPGSLYEAGRSRTLLKVKRWQDAEALVVGHELGAGRHKGRLGALLVETAEGLRFAVGTGFSDKQREEPPSIGATITFRYQELSDRGVPRFPVFAGMCIDAERSLFTEKGGTTMAVSSAASRRFEFSERSSHKFWEIQTRGAEVTVRFGRIGAEGQVQVKSFPNAEEAAKHVEKMVREKCGKGYREVS